MSDKPMYGEFVLQSRKIPGGRRRTARSVALSLALIVAAFLSPLLRAEQVYKSVDAEGHVVYSDRPDVQGGNPRVSMYDASTPPRLIHFCWTNCFTLKLTDGQYRRVDGTDETWTVERFSAQAIVLHRHDAPSDWNGFSPDVVYEGLVSEDRLINVRVNGKPTAGIVAAWGMALNTLPANNAERDLRDSAGSMTAVGGGASPAPGDEDPGMDIQFTSEQAPPPLPDEEQPPCSDDGYLWTPGYWGFGPVGYYWVRGVWLQPPRFGLLWTPGYWGFTNGAYVFHRGSWGAQVGYYGGINYGFGYSGVGYDGGRWVGHSFAYNSAVSHVSPNVIHTYRETAPTHVAATHVSYNGGAGGTRAVPSAEERAAARQPRIVPPIQQAQLVQIHPTRPSSTPNVAVEAEEHAAPAVPGATVAARTRAGVAHSANGVPAVAAAPPARSLPRQTSPGTPAQAREPVVHTPAPRPVSSRPVRAQPEQR